MGASSRDEDCLMSMLLEAPGLDALLLLEHPAVLRREVERLHERTEVLRQAHTPYMTPDIAA